MRGAFIVKAPSVTAPPCGLRLHPQAPTVDVIPWVRIILSQSYFKKYFTLLLLISLLHRRRGSNRMSVSFTLHSASSPLSRSATPLCPHRQIGFLHLTSFTTPAIFNSPRSPSKETPSVFIPRPLPPQPPPSPRLSLWGVWRGRRGQS